MRGKLWWVRDASSSASCLNAWCLPLFFRTQAGIRDHFFHGDQTMCKCLISGFIHRTHTTRADHCLDAVSTLLELGPIASTGLAGERRPVEQESATT